MTSLRTTGVLLAIFCVFGTARSARAFNVDHSALRVFPYEGRPGSTLFVSGYGLKPLTQLYILFACPNFSEAQAGNLRIIAPPLGPRTNNAGEFTGWRMTVPRLVHLVSSGCFVYAEDGVQQFYGPTLLGLYYILGPKDPIQPCDKRICVSVNPSPRRVKSGRIENVDVQAWAGALADVTVAYPGHAKIVERVKLDWNGSGRIRVPVPRDMHDTSHVRITVHCRLGVVTGDRRAEFAVVH